MSALFALQSHLNLRDGWFNKQELVYTQEIIQVMYIAALNQRVASYLWKIFQCLLNSNVLGDFQNLNR